MNSAKRGRVSTSTLLVISCVWRVDEMRHARRFGRVHDRLAVRRDAHAFRLHADRNLGDERALLDVHHGDEVVVLVGDVEKLARRIEHEELGIGARRQRADDLVGRRVDDLHGVVVAGAEQHVFAVMRDGDAARALADRNRLDDLHARGVEHRDGVVALVGDEDLVGEGRRRKRERNRHERHDGRKRFVIPFPPARLLRSGLIACTWSPAGRSPACRASSSDARSRPAAKPTPPCGRRRAGSAGAAAGPSRGASASAP